jgi:hypothetical protein
MDTRDPELFVCPASDNTPAAPRICGGSYDTSTGPLVADDQNIYTASVGVTSK